MVPTEGKFLWFLFLPGRYHIWTRKRRICAAGLKNEDFWPSYMANAQKMADLEKIGCPKNGIFGSDILGNMGVVLPGYYEPMIIWTYSFPYDDRYIQMKKVATPGRTQSVTPRELLQNTIASDPEPKEKQKPIKCRKKGRRMWPKMWPRSRGFWGCSNVNRCNRWKKRQPPVAPNPLHPGNSYRIQ